MKNIGCIGCHQIGQEATRTIPAQFGPFKTGEEAWIRRLQSGLAGEEMTGEAGFFNAAPLKALGEWTDSLAKGELPKTTPPRPQGAERNVVITTWEWGTEKTYMHDLISSDRRNPTVNAHGPLFGSPEYASDDMPILDPKTSTVTFFKLPVEDPNMPEAPEFGFTSATDAALRLLGRREDLEHQSQQSQCDVRQEGQGLAGGDGTRHGQSGLLQEGLRPSVGQGFSARPVAASGGDPRSEDDEVHLRRHLLCHPSPAVRL